MAFSIDLGIVGREFDRTVFPPITKEEILEYAAACGETNSIYTDETAARNGPYGTLVALPTFSVRLRGRHFTPKDLPKELVRSGFDAGKDMEFGEPIRPGDVITASSTVHDVYDKTGRSGRMTFIVFRTTFTNQNEKLVAIVDQRMMFRLPADS